MNTLIITHFRHIPQMFPRHVHYGGGGNALDSNHNAEIFLDMLHHANHACINPIGNTYFRSRLACKFKIIKEYHIILLVFRNAYERLHHRIGNVHHLGHRHLAVGHKMHNVTQWLIPSLVLTKSFQRIVCATDKNDIVDDRHKLRVIILRSVLHGNVCFENALFPIKIILQRHQTRNAGMTDSQRKPICNIRIQHRTMNIDKILGTPHNRCAEQVINFS